MTQLQKQFKITKKETQLKSNPLRFLEFHTLKCRLPGIPEQRKKTAVKKTETIPTFDITEIRLLVLLHRPVQLQLPTVALRRTAAGK